MAGGAPEGDAGVAGVGEGVGRIDGIPPGLPTPGDGEATGADPVAEGPDSTLPLAPFPFRDVASSPRDPLRSSTGAPPSSGEQAASKHPTTRHRTRLRETKECSGRITFPPTGLQLRRCYKHSLLRYDEHTLKMMSVIRIWYLCVQPFSGRGP